MMSINSFEVVAFGETYQVLLGFGAKYSDGSPVVKAFTADGEPFATITVCIPGTKLLEGEYLVKTWSENGPVTDALLKNGMFLDTGKRVHTRYTEASIWRIKSYV